MKGGFIHETHVFLLLRSIFSLVLQNKFWQLFVGGSVNFLLKKGEEKRKK